MADLRIPAPTRIPLGTATVAGQRVEMFLNPEWARYFESLNTQVVVTSNAVGLPGAPGTTGAAGIGVSLSDDAGGSVEFIPGPKGEQGSAGPAGLPLFMLAESELAQEVVLPATRLNEAFIAPTLLNSWVNFDATHSQVGYYKDAAGIVHLRGFVKSGTMTTPVFTLPAGYRPAYREVYPAVANDLFGACFVDPDGSVTPYAGSNVYFSLDGITFRAAGTY